MCSGAETCDGLFTSFWPCSSWNPNGAASLSLSGRAGERASAQHLRHTFSCTEPFHPWSHRRLPSHRNRAANATSGGRWWAARSGVNEAGTQSQQGLWPVGRLQSWCRAPASFRILNVRQIFLWRPGPPPLPGCRPSPGMKRGASAQRTTPESFKYVVLPFPLPAVALNLFLFFFFLF